MAVTKEALALFATKLPEGIELHATYMRDNGAFCVWIASDKKTLETMFEAAPVMKKGTEVVPVVQMFPPTLEYVLSLWQTMLAQVAPK
ncbi:MAG: hypothetical protein ACUVQ8_03720 [Nitrososphaeria archaeon]